MLRILFSAALVVSLAACQRTPPPTPGGDRPTQAVLQLVEHLRNNDPAGFATAAVPPALHARLETAWRTGRSRWPLDELPLEDRLAPMLAALAAPGARTALQQDFDRQFANASAELKSAATSLGLFGVQYIRHEGDYSAAERDHFTQAVEALSHWAAQAPLSDPKRARGAIALLTTAAKHTGIASQEDLAELGMAGSLERLGPFLAATKQAFKSYGLDLDAMFDSFDVRLEQQTGNTATVRVRYRLGGETVDALLGVERVDGRWYLQDYLRNAEASLAGPDARSPSVPAARMGAVAADRGARSP